MPLSLPAWAISACRLLLHEVLKPLFLCGTVIAREGGSADQDRVRSLGGIGVLMTAGDPGSVNRVLDRLVHCYLIASDDGFCPEDKTLGALTVEMGRVVIPRIHFQTKTLPVVLGSGCTFAGQPHLFFG
jgi:hypothetical protein